MRKNDENRNIRKPNYELLRIFAILLITLMHSLRSAYGHNIGFVGVNTIGNMGVTLFVLISGYFGIRMRASKLIWLWTTMLFYSLLIFSIDYYLSEVPTLADGNIKAFLKHLYTVLTPVTSNTWWFCTSYFILMLLSPLFNKAVDSMTKLQFQYLLAVLILVYSISPTFLMHSLSNVPNGKCTENMILAYFLGRYFAKEGIPLTIRKHVGLCFIGCVAIIFLVNYFLFDPLFMAKDHNFFIILGSICIFYYFGKTNISSEKAGNVIRYAASYAFPFYLMNIFLISKLEHQYSNLSGIDYFLGFMTVLAEVILISVLVELFRRLVMQHLLRTPSRYFDHQVEALKKKGTYGIYLNFFYTRKST